MSNKNAEKLISAKILVLDLSTTVPHFKRTELKILRKTYDLRKI